MGAGRPVSAGRGEAMAAWQQHALRLRGMEIRLGILRSLAQTSGRGEAALASCEADYREALRELIAQAQAILGEAPPQGEGG